MSEESKLKDPKAVLAAAEETIAESSNAAQVDSESEDECEDAPPSSDAPGSSAPAKKKRSKRKKIKTALTGGSKNDKPSEGDLSKAIGKLDREQLSALLASNPALARDLGFEGPNTTAESSAQAMEQLKKLSLQDIMTGLASSGKNAKDMASYKFWQTQPVPKFGDKAEEKEEGPIKIIDKERVSKEPSPLMEGFEWVTMDLTSDEELEEVFQLLNGHYVEDTEAMFRFNYSKAFLQWALLAPGWDKESHVGVRASKSRKLVAFISGVPVALRVRDKILSATEINFLCIHKKLRSKRLTPVLIKEITRRQYLNNIQQAIYTAGVILPTPVSTCRYFHRSLDWQKLYEVKFSPCPSNSKPSYQVQKYRLPEHTSTKGLRAMEMKDVDAVLDILKKYLARFDMAPVFTREEVVHWLLPAKSNPNEQVVWSYVVEDPTTKAITDYFSFYRLESTVIGNTKHTHVRAAYLFYYATTVALSHPPTNAMNRDLLKVRLNALMHDALILARKFKFDVFNALTLMDNGLFLEDQKFGKGDGQLHYYLYNYYAKPIAGGVDERNEVDQKGLSGVGVVML